MLLSQALAATSFILGTVNAITSISAVGSKFFDSDGNQFFVKGVAYQLTSLDPLVDTEQCTLDASLMKTLGANTIRVYHVDPTEDHDGCMSTFADNGIYLFVDLDTFTTQLEPGATQWNDTQFAAFSKVMDAFHSYDNTLGFFVGNEVITQTNESLSAPYIKAATRDMKAYRDSKGYRSIPIGYSAADISQLRPMLQDYLVCGGNASVAIDFFGLNAYEWCGDSSYTLSGYSDLNEMAQGYPVPIFFSETGCQTVRPRTFSDQQAILGPDMDGTWSGAIIYEWIEEANDYGLISYGPEVAPTAVASNVQAGFTRSGTPTPVSPDFSNLQAVWATLTPSGTPLSVYTSNEGVTTPACPSSTASGWLVDGNPSLPARDATLGASPTATSGGSGTPTSGTASASSTSKSSSGNRNVVPRAASGGNEMLGMAIGLFSVLIGVIWWL